MRKIVVDMQNFLFADSVATTFKKSDYEIDVVRTESSKDTVELCKLYKPFVLIMEVTGYTPWKLCERMKLRDDKIVAVTDVKGDGDSSNDRYILRAANGTSSKKGVTSQLIEKGNTEGIDAVSGATCTSKAILDACENALLSAKRQ